MVSFSPNLLSSNSFSRDCIAELSFAPEDCTTLIGISKLYCGQIEQADLLRYGRKSSLLPAHLLQFSADKKPVVVWNITRRCNLSCLHCYASANVSSAVDPAEISHSAALSLIDDLADFGVPVLLLSGGEPLLREDLADLCTYAVHKGLRAVVSSNGTLITPEKAMALKKAGVSYVGISLDGNEQEHNALRCSDVAFEQAMRGLSEAQSAGLKVGLRVTLNHRNASQIASLFNLIKDRDVPRICFYHLVNVGRGQDMVALSHAQTRIALDEIMSGARSFYDAGLKKEILTVDNHADGPYLWLKLLSENPDAAQKVYTLLGYNGGNSSGVGLGCIDWYGNVLPDQFWPGESIGNIHKRRFSEIWSDSNILLLNAFRAKKINVSGRCASCRFLDVCGGNFRSRALALTGDMWAADPACYLTDEEIYGPVPYV